MAHRTGSPWAFVPTLYFAEGLPYVIVTDLSVTLCKRLGVPNERIGLWTSLVAFPWLLKPLWGPLVELTLTKRRWIVLAQALITGALLLALPALQAQAFLLPLFAALALVAVLSATHDIAADGYYLLALAPADQAFFVGVRSTAYRLAMIFGSGVLVVLAGWLEERGGALVRAWTLTLGAAALVFGCLAAVNALLLPRPALDLPARRRPALQSREAAAPRRRPAFLDVLAAFFRQRRILAILAFILLYRCGESMISKMSGPFLLDTRAPAYEGAFAPPDGSPPAAARGVLQERLPGGRLALSVVEPPPLRGLPWAAAEAELRHVSSGGGLELSTSAVGVIRGTLGVAALVAGGILGGMVIARTSLRRCLWPMVLCMNVPNLFYVAAALLRPGPGAAGALIVADQFGYGFGFSAYLVYLMRASQGTPYPAASYAIATGLMALGAMGAGIASGYLQAWLGYAGFFAAVCLASVPGMLTLLWIPLPEASAAPARSPAPAP